MSGALPTRLSQPGVRTVRPIGGSTETRGSIRSSERNGRAAASPP